MAIQQVHSDTIAGTVIRVAVEYDVTRAWQAALQLVDRMEFTAAAAHCLATSVSELAHNLVNHTPEGGTITLSPLRWARKEGIEVTAEDSGPGIADVPRAMVDGYSTGGGLGGGLPAVRRLMDEFEITSSAEDGTCVVTRMWKK